MVDIKQYIKSEYISAEDIKALEPEQRNLVLTKQIVFEDITNPVTKELSKKLVATVIIKGEKRKWIVNRTNGRALAASLTTETDKWEGATVRLGWTNHGSNTSIKIEGVVSSKVTL